MEFPTEHIGKYETQLVEHFFQSMVNTSGMTLHIRQVAGFACRVCCCCCGGVTPQYMHHHRDNTACWQEQPPHCRGDVQGLCTCAEASDRGGRAATGQYCKLKRRAHSAIAWLVLISCNIAVQHARGTPHTPVCRPRLHHRRCSPTPAATAVHRRQRVILPTTIPLHRTFVVSGH